MAIIKVDYGTIGGGTNAEVVYLYANSSTDTFTIDLSKKYLVQNQFLDNSYFYLGWYEVENGVVSDCIAKWTNNSSITDSWWNGATLKPTVSGTTLNFPNYASNQRMERQIIQLN